jgi:hypothetical protein
MRWIDAACVDDMEGASVPFDLAEQTVARWDSSQLRRSPTRLNNVLFPRYLQRVQQLV